MLNKRLITIAFGLGLGFNSYSQNLIANSSFEDVNICTEANAPCSPSAWKTTSPFLLVYGGEKSNKSVAFTVFNPSVTNTRQYLQIKLLCPLVKDKVYRLSLKLKPGSIQIGSIGALFSDSIIFFNRDILIKRNPGIDLSDQMAKIPKRDRNNWNQFVIEYRAGGFEMYLIIGNFQTDSQQKRTFIHKPNDFTNYLYSIDDVMLTPIDKIELCPDFEKTREKLYSLTDRHPLKRQNLFGDDEPEMSETATKPDIDTIRLGSVFFEFDSYKIDSFGIVRLDSLFGSINKENIEFIKIHGHADSIGDQDYNLSLSLNRANSIKEFLSTQNLLNYVVDVQGYGDKFPIEKNSTEEGRKRNRRVEVIIKYKTISR